MAKKFRDDFANERAIEIYEWVLTQTESFKSSQIPGWDMSSKNRLAIQMLIDRGLIRTVSIDKPIVYRLVKVVDPAMCLEVRRDRDSYSGVTRYRVAPSIAASMGGISDLRKYSIKKEAS